MASPIARVCDALIVTGGPGLGRAVREPPRRWSSSAAVHSDRVVAGVCTGGMILAAAGILDGHRATTKREIAGAEVPPVRLMRERHPLIEVTESASLVDCGRVVTGGGVTLGIDATLHLLARLLGEDVAIETARIMEYTRAWRANREALPVIVQ